MEPTGVSQARLGTSDLVISRAGVGTAPIGSGRDWYVYWGPQDEATAVAAIRTALDVGVNWIDTAPFYGWGRAEEIVGRAVRSRRDRVLLFTKCGTVDDGRGGALEDLRPPTIRRELEASLARLRTDRVDLLQFHDPDPLVPIEESWGELQRLVGEGKVRHGGLSNHPVGLIRRAMTVGPVAASQHQYNLLHREVEAGVLPFCQAAGIGVLAWSPLASGFLVDSFSLDALDPDDFRRRHRFGQEPTYAAVRRLAGRLSELAARHGRRGVDLAVAWVLRSRAVAGAIVGVRDEQEAAALPRLASWVPPEEDLSAVEQAVADLNL